MSGLSRRDLIKASAGAAALAVPITALSSSAGGAAAADGATGATGSTSLTAVGRGPVMFCVHDATRGEVAIMHGADEVIVRDHQLVARVMDAASQRAV